MRLVILLMVAALVLLPSVAAQAPPRGQILYNFQKSAGLLVLDEAGRGQYNVTLNVVAQGFACVLAYEFRLQVFYDETFPKWAGSSVIDPLRRGFIPPPGPMSQSKHYDVSATLNFAWDLEQAPAGAVQVYRITAQARPNTAPTNQAACTPEPTFERAEPRNWVITVCQPKRQGGAGEGCLPAPEPVAVEQAGLAVPDLPFLGVLVAGLLGLRRRR